MNSIKYILSFILLLGWSLQVDAQRITRSTLCGTGGTLSNGTVTLRSTVGQCPGCSKIGNDSGAGGASGAIYQGFQQPVRSELVGGGDGGENDVPCFQSDFAVEVLATECGETYSFEYLGNADQTVASFEWNFGETGLPQAAFQANPNGIAFSSTGMKIISLTVSQDTCTETIRKTINVSAIGFGADFVVDDLLCFGDTDGRIQVDVVGGESPFTINWADGSTEDIRRDLSGGDYPVTVTDARNCEFTGIATVQTPDSLSVVGDAETESTAGAGDGAITLTVTGGTMPYTYLWEDGSVSGNRENLTSGIYIVTVTDNNGCSATDLIDFNTEEGGAGIEGEADEVFTPNFDGISDQWIIKDIDLYPNNEVLIYNRWGQLVYAVTGYTNDWMGTNNDGEELQTGAYWYIVKFNDPNDIQFSGVVTIVR